MMAAFFKNNTAVNSGKRLQKLIKSFKTSFVLCLIMIYKLLFFIVLFSPLSSASQASKRGILKLKKIGFLYTNAASNNFIFEDKDFTYTTNTYKLQAFYKLATYKSLEFELILQPQIQVLSHQLYNRFFVLPTEENFQEKIKEFTTAKTMHLYAFELGFSLKKELLKKLDVVLTAGLGLATIDTRTERLAKGFTFIENASLGVSYELATKAFLYVGTAIGHVSNFDTKRPNNGYSFVGFELGFSYLIE
jgi:hypothetical protein